MFTGIVLGMGQVTRCERVGQDLKLSITAPAGMLRDSVSGDSISVSGVCLTALQPGNDCFTADVSAETLARTTLGTLQFGQQVNLEPALRLSDRLGGHLVSGHVDDLIQLCSRSPLGKAERFEFSLPPHLARFVAVKGSVCLDGVSLTVNGVTQDSFEVCIIPHTLVVTTLGSLQPGQHVNLEVDLVARYVERLQHGTVTQA
jgi:riboflavin synthase